jgi:hypothetical protein
MQKLRLDRRLIRRRGWIGQSELERELASLPDSAAKATTLGAAADERESASDAGAAREPGAPTTAQ